jgi:hypothetical protein
MELIQYTSSAFTIFSIPSAIQFLEMNYFYFLCWKQMTNYVMIVVKI